ncbi:hypothetical protein BJ741DRAFT_614351 [Chytriomyces cf. hyalinus JEL632]|nr:hypothetical protein BJ741DRAFT_614351 [Chytriomyces cf. hyalinus JEL632]
MSSAACTATAPALQAALQTCGFVFDAAGNSKAPVGTTQAALASCVCSPANMSVFRSSLSSCATNPAAVSSLNSLISGCAATTSAGTGAGTGTGTGSGISTPCELMLTKGLQSLSACGVTIDASTGNFKQTASDAQTATCVCTTSNVLIYKSAQTACEAEASSASTQGVTAAKSLISGCASGLIGGGAGASAGTGSGSAGGSSGVVVTGNTAAPAKSSGADTVFGLVGLFAAGALLTLI